MNAREWVFVAVAVLAVYLVFQLIRALQVKDTPAPVENEAAPPPAADDAPPTEAPPAAGQATEAPPADPVGESFGLALEIRHLRRDLARLREEVDAQGREIESLRNTVTGQAAALDAARAAQRVSPHYSEALELAQRGLSAEVIAERCSISVAEAELVQSLAQESGK